MTLSSVPLTAAPGLDHPVLDVMHVHPVTVPAELPLDAAARQMAAQRIHAVLVVDGRGAPLGWVTTRGMLHNTPRDWAGARVGDAITESVVAVPPTATLRDALQTFLASGASHLLVQKEAGGPVLGLVAESDMVGVLAPPAATEARR
jgi:CBS domain-containing protein